MKRIASWRARALVIGAVLWSLLSSATLWALAFLVVGYLRINLALYSLFGLPSAWLFQGCVAVGCAFLIIKGTRRG